MRLVKETGLIVFAYMIGSVPFGLIVTKIFSSEDIRLKGSGNIGATNVMRVAGTIPGALTLALDFAKGVFPVYIAGQLTESGSFFPEDIYVCTVLLSAFFGHLYPVYMKFKGGGKGVATAAGGFYIISAPAFLISLFIFILAAYFFKHVSSGSLAGAFTIPFALWLLDKPFAIILLSIVTAVFILIRHKDNIKRITKGTEPVIWAKKSKL